MLYLVLLRYWYRTFIQTYSATSPLNPHWEMDKTFSPSYSPSQITYVEAEAVGFSRFLFHRKRTASTASASTSLVRSSPDSPIFKRIAVRSSPDPVKIFFSPDPVRSSPYPCSSLMHGHLCCLPHWCQVCMDMEIVQSWSNPKLFHELHIQTISKK